MNRISHRTIMCSLLRQPNERGRQLRRPRYKYHKMTMAKILQTIVTIPATPRKSNFRSLVSSAMSLSPRISVGDYNRAPTWVSPRCRSPSSA